MNTENRVDVNSDPTLSNAGVSCGVNGPSFRDSIPSTSGTMPAPPIVPPRVDMSLQPTYGMTQGYSPYGGLSSYSMGGMGGMGMGMGGYGGYGYGGYGGGYGMGMGGMGSPYGGFNRFGPMHGDIESRFIQLAEEGSRPAFESIQSVVHAVGSIAMMLENTFFALTSSFRAILGVAENFGRLRSLFAQFWSTFAVIRSINWLFRKLLVLIGVRSEEEFKAWAQAVAATQTPSTSSGPQQRRATWPILLFFGVITAAPYIVLRMLNGLSSAIHEKLNEPSTWQQPLRAVAQHEYQAASPQEISFAPNQVIYIAPPALQGHLWNSGWLMGSVDRKTAGLVPVNYVKVVKTSPPNNGANNSAAKVEQPKIDDLEKLYKEEM